MFAEMIPMRGVDDPFVFQLRIAAVDLADDVVRFERTHGLFQIEVGLRANATGTKCFA